MIQNDNFITEVVEVAGHELHLTTSRNGVLCISHLDTHRKTGKIRTMLVRREHIAELVTYLNAALAFSERRLS